MLYGHTRSDVRCVPSVVSPNLTEERGTLAQTHAQKVASDLVAAWLAARGRSNSWLVAESGVAPDTVHDFLNGHRWPKLGTQGKIETALAWPAGTIRQIANGGLVDRVALGIDGLPPGHTDPFEGRDGYEVTWTDTGEVARTIVELLKQTRGDVQSAMRLAGDLAMGGKLEVDVFLAANHELAEMLVGRQRGEDPNG